jgi:hypothetical protein
MDDNATLAAMPLYTNLDRFARGLAALGIGPQDPIPPEMLYIRKSKPKNYPRFGVAQPQRAT